MNKPKTLQSGTKLREFEIIRLIAEGGMGAVYEAKNTELGKKVAVKQTFFKEEYLRKAFKREAQILSNLRHKMLPDVSAHFFIDDDQFLVMQYIEGNDLAEVMQLRGSAFLPTEVLPWTDRLLGLLTYLHTQKDPIIHRDIKPSNIKLTPAGELYLLDFGLARGTPSDVTGLTTGVTTFGYSIYYAPLEQIRGQVTRASSDLFALAATLYHLMTGEVPVSALDRLNDIGNQLPDPLRLANELNPQVPESIAKVLAQTMALFPEKRPPTAAALRQLLREAAQSCGIPLDTPVKIYEPSVVKTNEQSEPKIPDITKLTESSGVVKDSPQKAALKNPAPEPKSESKSGWHLLAEFPVKCRNAYPLGNKRILVRKDKELFVLEDNRKKWHAYLQTPVRFVSFGETNEWAVATWDGNVYCFADGEAVASVELDGAVGDVKFCKGRWLVGTWKKSLVSISLKGEVTRLLPIDAGVLRIATISGLDRFAVAGLDGGITFYYNNTRVNTVSSVGFVSDMAFAGRLLITLANGFLIPIGLDGTPKSREPGDKVRIIPSVTADSCLLLYDNGICSSLNEAGVHKKYFEFAEGKRLVSSCRLPKQFIVTQKGKGCAYWRDQQQEDAWDNAVTGNLSADGRFATIVFPDKVQLYEGA